MLSTPSLAQADRVEQDLDAKITSALGIFQGLVGETVQVRVVYDDEMIEEFPNPPVGSPLGDSYKTDFPESNGAFDVGVEIEVSGIARSAVGKGDDGVWQHDIRINDEPERDRWQIFAQNFFDPVDQGSVELIGDTSYVLPGDGGLPGFPIFPPDYCATGNTGVESATGRFTAYAAGMISATDALAILRAAVGQPVVLNCQAC